MATLRNYRGKTVKRGDRVKVRFNSGSNEFAIIDAETDRVVGHSETIKITNGRFCADLAKRRREGGVFSYTWVEGFYSGTDLPHDVEWQQVLLGMRGRSLFTNERTNEAIDTTKAMVLGHYGRWYCADQG